MVDSRKVDIQNRSSLLDDVLKVDEVVVSHTLKDGAMSSAQRRLICEPGDTAAVLLFNVDTNAVLLVNQFKAPTLGKGLENGWITEAVAGMVDRYETPHAAAIRETMEQTGYRTGDLKLIAKFFSSPGSSSELVHLYYAEVSNADQVGKGGGLADEDMEIRNIPVDELLELIETQRVEDPKLLVGALWLKEELQRLSSEALPYSTVRYSLANQPDLYVGYKTGHISGVKGVSIWVNSENEDMVMDRYIGQTISASIRFLGARKDAEGNLVEDTINDALTAAVGSSAPVKIGTVFVTSSGDLKKTHGVDAILHVATVKGVEHGYQVTAALVELATCVNNVLEKADERNRSFWRRLSKEKINESILFPIIGAGVQLGLQLDLVAPRLVDAAIEYFKDNPTTTIREIYFLAHNKKQRAVLVHVLEQHCAKGTIRLTEP
jgi:nudix-type nucleoside diphosphatase (YffH/AdpP family)